MTEEKKVKGRKRHIVVDILGNLLHVQVHAANIHDTKAGCNIFQAISDKYPSILAFSADAGYRGTSKDYVENTLELMIDISKKIKDTFAILPKRWIVERTFAWINNFRRASKDYEILTLTAENIVRIAMIRVTLKKCF
ncbi:MAG: transposase [bacterium]